MKLTPEERDSFNMVKDLTKSNSIYLKRSYFKPGQIIMFSYNAKYDKNPYDNTPLLFVLGTSGKKYVYGLNFNWVPPVLRRGIIGLIWRSNKRKIEKGKDLVVSRFLLKAIFKNGLPAFRKYLAGRISKKGVLVPHALYPKIISLRAEHFIGISSEKAWALSKSKIKK